MDLVHPILCLALLPLETACLFTLWHWRLRSGSLAWLGLGIMTATLTIFCIALQPAAIRPALLLAMFAMYIVAGLAWASWADGLRPAEWGVGEVGIAVLATALFSIAATSVA